MGCRAFSTSAGGIFTGRVPFVWIGNVISNPGNNPNLFPGVEPTPRLSLDQVPESNKTSEDAILTQSFDVNGMVPDFKWPQVWTTNLAVDQRLFWDMLGTLEFIYGKDINAVYVRNADLTPEKRRLPIDGRPYYGGLGDNELNSFFPGSDEGVYVIDNTNDGYHFNATIQLRKEFEFGLRAMLSYNFLEAKSQLKSTEIASVLFTENPVQGDPNNPELSYSEFGNRHRITGVGTYSVRWSDNLATHFGLFFEVAEGNRFAGAGGNRYSYTYAGDVNGDGKGVNDLIYVPASQSEINLRPGPSDTRTVDQIWNELNAFIEQDDYLKENRGKITERFGAVNPWWWNIDFRVMQDFIFKTGKTIHTFQISLDILNVPSLLSIGGVRKVASSSATSPLKLSTNRVDPMTGDPLPVFTPEGDPIFEFPGVTETFIDDPGISSRWQLQLGIRYFFRIL